MNSIRVQRTISMGHRLPSYNGICSSPHGHNVTVELEVESMTFLDFKKVDRALDLVLVDFDHAMVLHSRDPFATLLLTEFPKFRLVLLTEEPSTENLAAHFFAVLRGSLASIEATLVSVTVHETAKYSATCRLTNLVAVGRIR